MKKRIAGLLSLFMIPTMLYNNTGIMSSPPTGLLNGLRAEAADISGRVLYVAENGNDFSGNGSSDAPYRSIKKAADEASAGTTILIRPGTYIEEDIRPRESGKEDAMIVFRPENSSDNFEFCALFYLFQRFYVLFGDFYIIFLVVHALVDIIALLTFAEVLFYFLVAVL